MVDAAEQMARSSLAQNREDKRIWVKSFITLYGGFISVWLAFFYRNPVINYCGNSGLAV